MSVNDELSARRVWITRYQGSAYGTISAEVVAHHLEPPGCNRRSSARLRLSPR
jgi:hypothetical protein